MLCYCLFTIKALECKDSPLKLVVYVGNQKGIPYKGTSECRNTHQIKVTCLLGPQEWNEK
jgi:hypothetical protein